MATAAVASDEAEWEIRCAYCLSAEADMNNPRRLPCGHVNCLKGIEDDMAANKSMLRCPKCRKVFEITAVELENHQPGLNISSGQFCQACRDIDKLTIAKVYCAKCHTKMCKKHEKQHEDLFLKHTNVISIADYVLKQQKIAPRYCPKHMDQPVTLACQKCLQRFCTECEELGTFCSGGGHHVIINIKKLAGKLRKELQEIKSLSMVTEASYKDFAKKCAEILDEYDTETKMLILNMHSARDEQIKELTQSYDKLELMFTEERIKKRGDMDKFVGTEVDGRLKELGDQMQLLDTAIHDRHEVDVIESYAKRKSVMEKLADDPQPQGTFEKISLKPCGTKCDIGFCLDKTGQITIAPGSGDHKEATFRFKIEGISKLDSNVKSPPHIVRNLPWNVMAAARQSMGSESCKTLAFFLQCNTESASRSWSCNASAELRILKQTDASGDTEPFKRRIEHTFISDKNDWGFSKFMTWSDMTDPSNGYIKDDCIILEVFLTADAPDDAS